MKRCGWDAAEVARRREQVRIDQQTHLIGSAGNVIEEGEWNSLRGRVIDLVMFHPKVAPASGTAVNWSR